MFYRNSDQISHGHNVHICKNSHSTSWTYKPDLVNDILSHDYKFIDLD